MPRNSPQKVAPNRHTTAVQLFNKLDADGLGDNVYGAGFTRDGRVFVISASDELAEKIPFQFHGRQVLTLVADAFPSPISRQTEKKETESGTGRRTPSWEQKFYTNDDAQPTKELEEEQIWMNRNTRKFVRITAFGSNWVSVLYTHNGKAFTYSRSYVENNFELYKNR